jgi:hypothetical protein
MTKSLFAACAAFTLAMVAGCKSPPAALPAAASAPPATPNIVTCTLKQSGEEFKGTCAVPCMVNALAINMDGPRPNMACSNPPREVAATLRKSGRPDHWLGTMQGKEPEDPTRFELNTATKVAKLPYGWFALQSAQAQDGGMRLTINANKQLPPTADDIRIIQRALSLVAAVNVWNKNDDRNCPPNPQKYSVFCALMQATEEVSGGVHYRQPALQAVREVVNEVGGTRVGKHRLMDYNNHPDTTLTDIHNLLRMAQARLEKRPL